MNNRFLMSYEYNKVMNEMNIFLKARTGKWRAKEGGGRRRVAREGNCLVNTLVCAFRCLLRDKYATTSTSIWACGLSWIYMSNAVLMTHHL